MFDPQALRLELARANLSAFQAAKLAGINPGTLYAWLSAKNQPRQDKLANLARAIGVQIGAFFAPTLPTVSSAAKPAKEEAAT